MSSRRRLLAFKGQFIGYGNVVLRDSSSHGSLGLRSISTSPCIVVRARPRLDDNACATMSMSNQGQTSYQSRRPSSNVDLIREDFKGLFVEEGKEGEDILIDQLVEFLDSHGQRFSRDSLPPFPMECNQQEKSRKGKISKFIGPDGQSLVSREHDSPYNARRAFLVVWVTWKPFTATGKARPVFMMHHLGMKGINSQEQTAYKLWLGKGKSRDGWEAEPSIRKVFYEDRNATRTKGLYFATLPFVTQYVDHTVSYAIFSGQKLPSLTVISGR